MKEILTRVLLTLVTVLTIAYIFSNSLATAEKSTKQSEEVLEVIQNVIPNATHNGVRKSAHFSEFTVLGFMFILTYIAYTKKMKYIYILLILVVLVPVIDELLQLTSKGRACQVSDMAIDFFGECFGIMIGLIVFLFCKKCLTIDTNEEGKL